ncbi:MAG: helix-turn-helix transcriptional regulator [Humibacillus sp.]|nr:helix-turn-helix transcriptional regulator [Humibacillus sp.]MDN5777067.1 helix-turn-helix transcriptional regulator [Humibacillus sp.]
MRSYRQYCPIARASEVLAERWTPIILRNLLGGATTFTTLADAAPGLSRTLLTQRLRELQRAGVVEITPHPSGRGHSYRPTPAGRALGPVLMAMGTWAEEWFELDPTASDPGFLLHSWCQHYLALDLLPTRQVVVRFDFVDQPERHHRLWMVFAGASSEVCRAFPGYVEDLVVTAESTALAEWHLGRIDWATALRSGRIQVAGPPGLARALPTWNRRSTWAHRPGRLDLSPEPPARPVTAVGEREIASQGVETPFTPRGRGVP